MPNTVTQVGKRNIIAWNARKKPSGPSHSRSQSLREARYSRGYGRQHDVQRSGEKVVESLNCHGIEAESKSSFEEVGKLDIALASLTFGADLIVSAHIPVIARASRIWFNEYRNDQTEQDPNIHGTLELTAASVMWVHGEKDGRSDKDRLVLASSSWTDFVAEQTPAISHAAWIQPSSDATTCWSM